MDTSIKRNFLTTFIDLLVIAFPLAIGLLLHISTVAVSIGILVLIFTYLFLRNWEIGLFRKQLKESEIVINQTIDDLKQTR